MRPRNIDIMVPAEPASASGTLSLSDAPTIASYALQDPGRPEIELAQVRHRIRLIQAWGDAIAPGSRVLELGCGQGTATTVLAEAVGPVGRVDAVDPGAPDYGAPFTLAQAQRYISEGPVGARITWHRATPEQFLESSRDERWDAAVLCHCIWYFESPGVLEGILRALRRRAKSLCVAEYALRATDPAAAPHVLAVLARSMLECYKSESSANVKTPASPAVIREIAARAGWGVPRREDVVVPEPGLLDGSWETGTVVSRGFEREIEEAVVDERTRFVIRTARDATVAAVEGLGGGADKMRTMDVWAAVFEEMG